MALTRSEGEAEQWAAGPGSVDAMPPASNKWLIAGASILTVAVLAGAGLWARHAPTGPSNTLPMVTVTSASLPLGTPFTLGNMMIASPEAAEVEIVSVDANTASNVEVEGALAVFPLPAGYGGLTGAEGFPPVGQNPEVSVQPALGSVFSTDTAGPGPASIELLLGLRATSGPFGAVNGVTVTYLVDGERHVEHFPYAAILCVAPFSCDEIDPDEALGELGLLPERT